MTDDPLRHFDLPFRFEGGQLATVPQDTVEDVQNKVETLIRCPLGFRDELPGFGWPQQTFDPAPLDTTRAQALVDEWVPDARATLSEHGTSLDEAVRFIEVHIDPEGS